MQAQELTKAQLKQELKVLKKLSKKLSKKKKDTKKELSKTSKKYKNLKQKFAKLELSLKQHDDAMLAVTTLLDALNNQKAEANKQEVASAEQSKEKQAKDALNNATKKEQAKTHESKTQQESKPQATETKQGSSKKPTTKAKTASRQKKDDLKLIDGIGPTLERLLNEANIRTWSQLARASQTKLKRVLSTAGPRLSKQNPERWPEQALLARDGRFEELKLLQDNLKTNS